MAVNKNNMALRIIEKDLELVGIDSGLPFPIFTLKKPFNNLLHENYIIFKAVL
ncbi:MAG: hypothetical protein R2798_12210 [Chitinophagales bacterium]|nr:hypothetical protein [Bacteroidota bacterium]MCB9043013.1 hypothetical protein [Chitinophagales bacterium]